jgi:dihydropteroate synthase
MTRYLIRRLLLRSHAEMLAELGEAQHGNAEMFIAQARRHAWILKIISRSSPISHHLLAAYTLRGIGCWLISATKAYVFSNPESLEELCRARSFANSDEEIFSLDLKKFLEAQQRDRFVLRTHRKSLDAGRKTLVMGVLNCTPDSFSDGGRYFEKQAAIDHAIQMVEAGADIIDVGGESTRPAGTYGAGAMPVSEAEEIERVVPVIEALAKSTSATLSIDTYKSPVAKAAIGAGASMVNDISGFQFDPKMPDVVAQSRTPAVVMHIKGTPRNMQQNPTYENLMDELYEYFDERLQTARSAGISADQIIIDPGLGFGKRVKDNYEIIRRLEEFRGLGCAIMVGPSRKSFIGKVLDAPVDQRLEGTAAAVALAVANGAHIVRVHDVKEVHRVVKIADVVAGHTGVEEV